MGWTLTGTFTQLAGDPAQGTVVIKSDPPVLEDSLGDQVFISPSTLTLQSDGTIPPNDLPWTDDPDLPAFTYTIQARLHHRILREMTGIEVSTTTAQVDYADLQYAAFGESLTQRVDDLTADLAAHEQATTSVHGIADTAALVTSAELATTTIDGGSL